MSYDPIVVTLECNASPAKVWKAITDVNEMVQWYFENIPDFKAEVGFYTEFLVVSGGRNFLHQWRVTEVIPQKKLVYNWKFEGYEGTSNSHFELSPTNSGTLLTLTAVVMKPFDERIPEFKRESGVAGWNYLITESLGSYLRK